MNDCTVKRLINKTVTSISGKTVQPLQSMHIIDLAADGLVNFTRTKLAAKKMYAYKLIDSTIMVL